MLPGFLNLWPFAMRRALARWRLLVPLAVGSVLAVALMSSTFIYGDAVRQLGLDFAIDERTPSELDIDLIAYYAPTTPDAYREIRREVESAIEHNVAWFVEDSTRSMEGSTFFVNRSAAAGRPLDTSPEAIEGDEAVKAAPRRRAFFFFQTQFEEQTTLVAGEVPGEVVVGADVQGRPTSAPEIPVVILEETALRQGLGIGDRLLAVPHWEDVSTHAVVRIAGIVRRNDPEAGLWRSDVQRYVTRSQNQNFIPLFVPEETFIRGVGTLFPKMLSDYSWGLFVDMSQIDVRNVERAQFGLQRMNSQLRSRISTFNERTELDTVLAQFKTKDLFGRIPLLVIVMMILGIVAYFLVMVAQVVVDRHQGEVALLRSRGADGSQVMALYLWETSMIVTLAFFLGPLIALGATSLLGYTAAFSDLTGGGALPVTLTVNAYAMALGGAAIAFVALLVPTIQASGLNPLRYRAGLARPPGMPLLTRYYIDIFISIIAGLLYWELTQRGTVVTSSFSGEQSVDHVLLAAPAIFLLAIGLLLLRFFPLVARGMGWLASSFRHAWLVLGLWQIARNPVPYTRPILLLMLASSVAMFAANFGGTIQKSYEQRALYRSGGDLLVEGVSLGRRGASVSFEDRISGVIGDSRFSPAYRGRAYQALQIFSSTRFDLLAVDPQRFAEVAWYRDDFSSASLTDLMRSLESESEPLPGLALPADATTLGVWARPATPRRDISLRVRLMDVNGRHADFELGRLTEGDWQFLEVSLESTGQGTFRRQSFVPQPPLRLISLTVRQLGGMSLNPGAVYIDDLQVGSGPESEPVFLERFDEEPELAVANDSPGAVADSLEISASVTRDGRGTAGLFIWGTGSLLSTRGLLFGTGRDGLPPLPVIASRAALDRLGETLGSEPILSISSHIVPSRIIGVVDFFPTMDPFDDGFLITSLPLLLKRINGLDLSIDWQPNEIWLATGLDGEERAAFVESVDSQGGLDVIDRAAIETALQADPLIAAGWKGILNLVFGAVVFVTLIGFGIYSYVQAQQRRVEFALLRGMGISLRGLAGIVILEQTVVIVVGLALGSWIGYQFTSILMPFLDLTEEGSRVLPPFATRMNWPAIIATYGIMAAVFLGSTVGLVGFFSRVAIQRVLRFGE